MTPILDWALPIALFMLALDCMYLNAMLVMLVPLRSAASTTRVPCASPLITRLRIGKK